MSVDPPRDRQSRLQPTGECWCGCGAPTALGHFFRPGHDRRAESAVIAAEYGSIAEFIAAHGYGPGGKSPTGKNTRKGEKAP